MIIWAPIFWVMIAAGSPLDPPPISSPVIIVVLGVCGLITIGILVLTFIKLWMDVVGKRTSATVKIEAHSDSNSKDKEQTSHATLDISGFVAVKDFEQHKEEARLRAVGLETQISNARHEFNDQMGRISKSVEAFDLLTSEWKESIADDVKETAMKLAATEREMTIIARTQTNMDQKIDRLIERHIPSRA